MAGPLMSMYLKYRKNTISAGDIPMSFDQWKKSQGYSGKKKANITAEQARDEAEKEVQEKHGGKKISKKEKDERMLRDLVSRRKIMGS
jgi:hypothetical protein